MPLVDMQHHMMYMIVKVFAFPTFAGIKSPVIHSSSFLTCITYHPFPYVLLHLLGAHASKRREQAYPALDFTTFSITSYYSTLHSGNILLLCVDFGVSQPLFRLATFASARIFVERWSDTIFVSVSFHYRFLYPTLGV
jgi:hypothetical protein